MYEHDDYIPFDPRQPLGEERRYSHGEGCLLYGEHSSDTKDRLYVKRTPRGFLYNCFNCGAKGFKSVTKLSSSQIRDAILQRTNRTNTTNSYKSITLPPDFTRDIPENGIQWLLKYISFDQISQFNIGYSECINRIILPIYKDKKLSFWQGRSLLPGSKTNPKYITMGNSHITSINSMHRTVVIVEDYLSGIKVSPVSNSLVLFGSAVKKEIVSFLKNKDRVIVWLDWDKKRLSLEFSRWITQTTGIPSSSRFTKLDPKEYTVDEVRDILYSTFKGTTEE